MFKNIAYVIILSCLVSLSACEEPENETVTEPGKINITPYLLPVTDCHQIVILNGRFSELHSTYPRDDINILDTDNLPDNIVRFKQKSPKL